MKPAKLHNTIQIAVVDEALICSQTAGDLEPEACDQNA
jgi:hypothetical protein